jgi:hypothetical protein
MNKFKKSMLALSVASGALALCNNVAMATAPCEDFGECKVLIEINSSDGDIGFHFLMDGDDLNSARIYDPEGKKVFEDQAKGSLKEQKLTETFAESAEPLCWEDPDADEDEEIVTIEEFLDRWTPGMYLFSGKGDNGEMAFGETELTLKLPAAPSDVDFDDSTGVISWEAGDDLGNCATATELDVLVADGLLDEHPESVTVDAWEVVFEPDMPDPEEGEQEDPLGKLKFSIRVAGDVAVKEVSVPAEYLASLPDDTPVKVEVGAIGGDDNATFTEEDGFCVNEDEGCED